MAGQTQIPKKVCVDVALNVPLRQVFSYLFEGALPQIGVRVKAPFGRRKLVGVVVAQHSQLPPGIKLKSIDTVLDETPLFSPELIQLVDWTARYYHQPLGEVWRTSMPVILRKGRPVSHGLVEKTYRLNIQAGDEEHRLSRAPVQRQLVDALKEAGSEFSRAALLKMFPGGNAVIKALLKKGLLLERQKLPRVLEKLPTVLPNKLTAGQAKILKAFCLNKPAFRCQVLEGVTGSGKTEVYFSMIDGCMMRGEQTLVLLPEIALTDQLFSRFMERFGSRVVQVHSGMNDTERYRIWWQVRAGNYAVVLATRSGIFMEFMSLGLIIVDEEHDSSYKQHDGVRYHARSLAIKRALLHDIPIVLGSATPALETCFNVEIGRYQRERLSERIAGRKLPNVELLDLNQDKPEAGLCKQAISALSENLSRGHQALVFINRRGYAPVLFCRSCQWTAQCKRCDAKMTLHRGDETLQCHHCGAKRSAPLSCDKCSATDLINLGEGTQKIEETIARLFPKANIQRFDRDELNSAIKLKQAMNRVHALQIDILVGTQLLSKGHDFSRVNLVLVINADQGLHSIDFRAPEQMTQQLVQVAGRAGRGEDKGRVLIQTYWPLHPALQAVKHHRYAEFALSELQQRKLGHFPPYSHMALWRARAKQANKLLHTLEKLARYGRKLQPDGSFCFDPVASPMFKRGGLYHAQLLVSANERSTLHRWLDLWIARVEKDNAMRTIKWSIDIDPVSLF